MGLLCKAEHDFRASQRLSLEPQEYSLSLPQYAHNRLTQTLRAATQMLRATTVQLFKQRRAGYRVSVPKVSPNSSAFRCRAADLYGPERTPCSPNNLRWCPPVAHAPWLGVQQATAYAPICAQIETLGVFAGPANNNEDCLYLNVFTPNLGGHQENEKENEGKLPVIFWIHGGGNVDGETPGYDGSKMALEGRTVVVTVEYRLNLMAGWRIPRWMTKATSSPTMASSISSSRCNGCTTISLTLAATRPMSPLAGSLQAPSTPA